MTSSNSLSELSLEELKKRVQDKSMDKIYEERLKTLLVTILLESPGEDGLEKHSVKHLRNIIKMEGLSVSCKQSKELLIKGIREARQKAEEDAGVAVPGYPAPSPPDAPSAELSETPPPSPPSETSDASLPPSPTGSHRAERKAERKSKGKEAERRSGRPGSSHTKEVSVREPPASFSRSSERFSTHNKGPKGPKRSNSPKESRKRKEEEMEAEEVFVRRLEPFPHQKAVIDEMERTRGLIAAHATGTGKTLIAVMVVENFMKSHPGAPVFLVTPVSLQGNMQKEMRACGMNPKNPLLHFHTIPGFCQDFSVNFQKCRGGLIIIDEAHNLRTQVVKGGAKRARTALACCKQAAKVLLLTATPLVNNVHDLANLVAMVKGVDVAQPKEHTERMEKDMKNYLGGLVSLYYPKKSSEYPSLSTEVIYIGMSPQYRDRYERIKTSDLPAFDIKNPLPFYNGLRQASNNILGDTPKTEWVLDFVRRHPGEPMIIFSNFLQYGIDLLQKNLTQLDITYREITGSVKMSERTQIVEDQRKGLFQVLFISRAGGEGLDLLGIRHVILFDPCWNPSAEEQVIGRARRYRSHVHLPQEQRNVKVYRLAMVFQEEYPKLMREGVEKYELNEKNPPSVDLFMMWTILRKETEIKAWMAQMNWYSVEKGVHRPTDVEDLRHVFVGGKSGLWLFEQIYKSGQDRVRYTYRSSHMKNFEVVDIAGENYREDLIKFIKQLAAKRLPGYTSHSPIQDVVLEKATASHYTTLGITPKATSEQIKNAYRKKAKEVHPDRGGAHDHFVALGEAYSVLIDPAARRRYDLLHPNRARTKVVHGFKICFYGKS